MKVFSSELQRSYTRFIFYEGQHDHSCNYILYRILTKFIQSLDLTNILLSTMSLLCRTNKIHDILIGNEVNECTCLDYFTRRRQLAAVLTEKQFVWSDRWLSDPRQKSIRSIMVTFPCGYHITVNSPTITSATLYLHDLLFIKLFASCIQLKYCSLDIKQFNQSLICIPNSVKLS